MRVMLMLCVKEKSFDAPVMENLFQQYIEAEVIQLEFSFFFPYFSIL